VGMVWAGWTIGIEMPFYLLFPFIWKAFERFKEIGLFIISIICTVVVYYHYLAFKDADNGVFWVLSFFRFLLVFIMGLWVYLLSLKIKKFKFAPLLGNVIFLLGFTLLLLRIFDFYKTEFRFESFYSGFFFSLMLLGASLSNFSIYLDTKFLKWLGRNSYSIYLIHTIVINRFDIYIYNFLRYRTQSTELAYYGAMAFTIIITFLLSEIAWRLIEKPGINFGNTLVQKLKMKQNLL
jgi:peptidoglycan/LPS O-acetylase OafA/YrhL